MGLGKGCDWPYDLFAQTRIAKKTPEDPKASWGWRSGVSRGIPKNAMASQWREHHSDVNAQVCENARPQWPARRREHPPYQSKQHEVDVFLLIMGFRRRRCEVAVVTPATVSPATSSQVWPQSSRCQVTSAPSRGAQPCRNRGTEGIQYG